MDEQKDGTESQAKSEIPQIESEAIPSLAPEVAAVPKPAPRESAVKVPKSSAPDPETLREVAASDSGGPRRPNRRLTLILVLAILAAGIFAFVSKSSSGDTEKIQGKVALSESELKDIVTSKKLTVYWVGPLEGAKYTITATTPGIVYLKYIPSGASMDDTKIFFRTIGTYSMVNAYAVTRSTGALTGNVGFTNADGYSVFYSLSRPTNIYLGIKKVGLQLEIFDPRAAQALRLATVQGQLRKLT